MFVLKCNQVLVRGISAMTDVKNDIVNGRIGEKRADEWRVKRNQIVSFIEWFNDEYDENPTGQDLMAGTGYSRYTVNGCLNVLMNENRIQRVGQRIKLSS